MYSAKPSDIRYSQDSISNTFDIKSLHSDVFIGETLDMICEGRCSINDIPKIRVGRHDGNYVTLDNRRLWVFRQLERLGRCSEVTVRWVNHITPAKLTSTNDGLEVRVRGSPGGTWYRKASRGTTRSVSPGFTSFNNYNDTFHAQSSRPTSYSASRTSRVATYVTSGDNRNYGYSSSGYGGYSSSGSQGSGYRQYQREDKKDDGWWCTIL